MNVTKFKISDRPVRFSLLLTIFLTGLLLQSCGSNAESQCLESQYLSRSPGNCDQIGTCADKPVACTMQYDPVCGCDGITYGNACEAAAAGVNVSTSGECPVVTPPCTSNADGSNPGEYCQKADGDCSGQGVIQQKPEACTMQYDPVCGCDGITYGNACEAAAAGVNVLSKGICSP